MLRQRGILLSCLHRPVYFVLNLGYMTIEPFTINSVLITHVHVEDGQCAGNSLLVTGEPSNLAVMKTRCNLLVKGHLLCSVEWAAKG